MIREFLPEEEEQIFPCPYLEDGTQTRLFLSLITRASASAFGGLLAQGYRRSGGFFYRNACRTCSACLPIRIDAQAFRPSRSQRRTQKKNADLRVMPKIYAKAEPRVNTEKLNLYTRYMRGKHAGDSPDPIRDLTNLHYGYPSIHELHFYLGERLVGVSILDEAPDAFSANYFYYDPDFPRRRLGIFSLMEEIRYAVRCGKRWHYLGFLIRSLPKMAYKEQFLPHQILQAGEWCSP